VGATGLTRRQALAFLGTATAGATVAGCSHSDRATNPRHAGQSSNPSPSGWARTQPSAADWRALRRRLHGTLWRPGEGGYDRVRLLFNRRFDPVEPQAVVSAVADSDVAAAVAFARRFDLPLRIRSGGHSYIGASAGPGLVVDLRPMSTVSVTPDTRSATIGAGAALVDVYSTLAGHGVSIPAGSCPTVGVSGLTLGGGVGVVARRYGLTCDRLTAARLVTADGAAVTCSPNSHADLFWALRGGGGSFGVVTSLTFATHPTTNLAHAYLAWPWSAAVPVVEAWQSWAAGSPDTLWSAAHVLATDSGGPPTVTVAAVMVAGSAELEQRIGELVQAVPSAPTSRFVTEAGYEDTMMLEAGCAQQSVAACHVASETRGGTLPRDAFVAGSDFFRHPIPRAGLEALVAAVQRRQSDPRLGAGGAAFDALGGAVDAVSADATAWVHRGALFDAQYTASWGLQPGNGPLARNQHSLADIHAAVRHYATGQAYQNYADDSLRDPQQAYYGANLPRLVEVRRRYDPAAVFTQPQGVPLT
jgi:FAD/FMN-containing dehydrogenase